MATIKSKWSNKNCQLSQSSEAPLIDKKTMNHVAKLSRLELSEEQAQKYTQELSQILNYFDQISKIDTKGVEPLYSPSEGHSHFRNDTIEKKITTEELLQNAPERAGNLFKVPPVI